MKPASFKFNVLGTDKGTGKIVVKPLASNIVSGSETNQIYIDIDELADQTITRDLEFGDMKKKLDMNKPGDREKKKREIMKNVANEEKAIFIREYTESLDRGFMQKDAKRIALQAANKYRDEEISYWFKKYDL